jgi:hypothetical protein
MFIEVTEQEHAVILASLRYWQREGRFSSGAEHEIATDCGKHAEMSEEIDELCDKLNGESPTITIGINVEGGCVQNVMTDAQGINIDCIKVDYDVDGADAGELTEVQSPTMVDPDSAFVMTEIVEYTPEWMRCYRQARDAKEAAEQPCAT